MIEFEEFPYPVIAIEDDLDTIVKVNSVAEQWLGRSRKVLAGRSLQNSLSITSANTDHIAIWPSWEAPSQTDVTVLDCTGKSHSAHISLFRLPVGQALLINLSASRNSPAPVHDVRALSNLGRMMAHEIRNPLAGINGAAQLLMDDSVADEQKDLLDLIIHETSRIERLTDRMLNMGEMQSRSFEPVNIHSVLDQAARNIASTLPDSVRISKKYDPSLPSIMADHDSLVQLVLNLIKNAKEAISNDGLITIKTAYSLSDPQRPITMAICDTGAGIAEDVKTHLFQPFVTSKNSGQGLGLSVVAAIVEAHNGTVSVESKPGHTEFTIRLPLRNSHEEL